MNIYGCAAPDYTVEIEQVEARSLRLLVSLATNSQSHFEFADSARLVLVTLAEIWKNMPTGAGFIGKKMPPGEGWLLHNSPQHQELFAPLLPRLWTSDLLVKPNEYKTAYHHVNKMGWLHDSVYYQGGRIIHLSEGETIHSLSTPATGLGESQLSIVQIASIKEINHDIGTTWQITAHFQTEGWTALAREGWKLTIHSAEGFLCPRCHADVELKSLTEQHESHEAASRHEIEVSGQKELHRLIHIERYTCAWCGSSWDQDFTRLELPKESELKHHKSA